MLLGSSIPSTVVESPCVFWLLASMVSAVSMLLSSISAVVSSFVEESVAVSAAAAVNN